MSTTTTISTTTTSSYYYQLVLLLVYYQLLLLYQQSRVLLLLDFYQYQLESTTSQSRLVYSNMFVRMCWFCFFSVRPMKNSEFSTTKTANNHSHLLQLLIVVQQQNSLVLLSISRIGRNDKKTTIAQYSTPVTTTKYQVAYSIQHI